MQRLTAANYVTSMHCSPQADPSTRHREFTNSRDELERLAWANDRRAPRPPSEEQKLRDWLGVLNGPRSSEAQATLTAEGCTHEVGILVQTSDGPLLVYAMAVEDEERSRQAGLDSRHAIDADHKRVRAADLAGEPEMERLLDLHAS